MGRRLGETYFSLLCCRQSSRIFLLVRLFISSLTLRRANHVIRTNGNPCETNLSAVVSFFSPTRFLLPVTPLFLKVTIINCKSSSFSDRLLLWNKLSSSTYLASSLCFEFDSTLAKNQFFPFSSSFFFFVERISKKMFQFPSSCPL